MSLPVIIANQIRKRVIKRILSPKPLNVGEDLVVEEMKKKNSPMHKDVFQWTERDKSRALKSPSYPHNLYLQRQVQQYNKTRKKK